MCSKGPPKILIVGAGTGIPTFLFIASGGASQLEPALMAGIIVGGVSMAIYGLYSCHWNIVECTGSGLIGTVRAAACSVV